MLWFQVGILINLIFAFICWELYQDLEFPVAFAPLIAMITNLILAAGTAVILVMLLN